MIKTILITGATDGIGLLTAKHLAGRGHNVLLHGRSAAKLTDAQAEVGGHSMVFQADLASLDETRALAQELTENAGQIDVLLNNAGVLKTADPILANGQDVRFVVNTLAPYLLTKALLPMMPDTGRVINLSSAAQAPVDMDAMKGGRKLADMDAYAQSKRAITLWSASLAKKLPDGPAMIAVNPGSLLASKMVKEGFGIAGHDLNIGADILCRLALDEAFADATGRYWDNDAQGFAPVDMSQAAEVTAMVENLIH